LVDADQIIPNSMEDRKKVQLMAKMKNLAVGLDCEMVFTSFDLRRNDFDHFISGR